MQYLCSFFCAVSLLKICKFTECLVVNDNEMNTSFVLHSRYSYSSSVVKCGIFFWGQQYSNSRCSMKNAETMKVVNSGEGGPFFVLVGGDAQEYMGGDIRSRYCEHTSLTHIGKTYAFLRASGVPRDNIITIVQLNDFLSSPHMQGSHPMKSTYLTDCQRLIEEGGADYDFRDVNPGTIWSVLQGKPPVGAASQKVVPANCGALFFAIYSHGDCHPCSADESLALRSERASSCESQFEAPKKLNPLQHEWFAHMPYPTTDELLKMEMLSFVATEGATGLHFSSPERYLYATQLRATFVSLFSNRPDRPIIALLNFCRSGGALEFMRQPAIRDYYSANKWPLVLISSSQAEYDALVGGMWTSFFHHLTTEIKNIIDETVLDGRRRTRSSTKQISSDPMTILKLIESAKTSYFQQNVYALHDFVVTAAYVSSDSYNCWKWNSYTADLRPLLAAGPGGTPDYEAIAQLQERYRRANILIWDTQDWMISEVDLASVVRDAFRSKIAIPDVVYGSDSRVGDLTLSELFHKGADLRSI